MPPALLFFLKIALAIWDLLWFHANFRIACSIFVKNAVGILIGISLSLLAALNSTDILTKLTLLIHEHVISFHLFLSSICFLQFSVYRSFTALVKFILKYFIVFDSIANEIVFLISCSDISLLMYRNSTDFCMLFLYLATLLNLLISSNRVFLWESLGFLKKYIYIFTFIYDTFI